MDKSKLLKQGGFILRPQGEGWVFAGDCATSSHQPEGFAVYAPDFFLETEQPWLSFSDCQPTNLNELKRLFEKPKQINIDWQLLDKADFTDYFTKIKSDMHSDLQKAVPIVFEKANYNLDQNTLSSILANLLGQNSGQYLYGLWQNGQGIVGRTPELLFERKQKSLYTMALAGTAPTSSEESLFNIRKERREHQLVIDDIVNQLSKLGPLHISETCEFHIEEIKHLRTDIRADLQKNITYDELVKTLHPTSALGVYPRHYGLSYLKSLCDYKRRQRYGAPFGFAFNDEALAIVAIRNIQWDQGEILLGSGCGVVVESEIEKEWQELILKRNSVKRALL